MSVERAADMLRVPPDFAYWGDLHENEGWGSAFGQHRDSDALDRSNWEVITTDLLSQFPDDCAIERSNHWAVGWHDTLRIKVLVDPSEGIIDTNLTDVFRAADQWLNKLDNYPVADEDHFSELEWNETITYLSDEINSIWNRNHDEEMPAGLEEAAISYCTEDSCSADDIPYSLIEAAVEECWINGLIEDATAIHPNQLRMNNA